MQNICQASSFTSIVTFAGYTFDHRAILKAFANLAIKCRRVYNVNRVTVTHLVPPKSMSPSHVRVHLNVPPTSLDAAKWTYQPLNYIERQGKAVTDVFIIEKALCVQLRQDDLTTFRDKDERYLALQDVPGNVSLGPMHVFTFQVLSV